MQSEKNKLFVSGLDYAIDDYALSDLFSALEGVTVTSAKVIMDRETGRSRGFGFVEVETDEMAQIAIEKLNDTEVSGRKIFVNVARPQEKRNDRFGGSSDRRSYR